MPRVFRQFATLALVVAASVALAACGGAKSAPGGKDVAATVNGKDITLSEVDRLVNQQTQGQQMSTLQQAALRLQVLDKLIERQVLYNRAEKEKTVPNDDEVTTFVNQQRQKLTAEEWEKSLKENNLTEAEVRDEARKDIAINKLQDKLFGKITIRDQEIADFYNANQQQFVDPRGVYLSDIVVDPRDSGGMFKDDAKSDAEATAKIQRIYAQLKGGADFADVARASSEDQSGVRGGDIGMANEQTLQQYGFSNDLIGRFFNQMQVGSYTEPMRFPNGSWYIFKLTNRQLENKPLKLEDPGVRDKIKEALISQRQEVLQVALIRNAMSDVTVVNKLAESMLGDPNMLGGNQSVTPGATPAASPASSASPAASPSASPAATASPAASATPAASPKAAASPAAAPKGAAPKGQPSR
ncbi:MAG TPA: SurA N-terminal domain-containing protein [Pyrinomonadaceae bacterium]|nr:SurA N-terminal domain-containing protein [Pyrinomonadaceae bacterium]